MRTTIELTVEQRARLLALAARRGHKGFSRLIQEAVDIYLRDLPNEDAARRRAASLRGTLSNDEAQDLRESARKTRGSWR